MLVLYCSGSCLKHEGLLSNICQLRFLVPSPVSSTKVVEYYFPVHSSVLWVIPSFPSSGQLIRSDYKAGGYHEIERVSCTFVHASSHSSYIPIKQLLSHKSKKPSSFKGVFVCE